MKHFIAKTVEYVRTQTLSRTDVREIYDAGLRVCTKVRAFMYKKHRTHKHMFLVILFICGFVVGAGAKVIARETIMIGYNDYMIMQNQ